MRRIMLSLKTHDGVRLDLNKRNGITALSNGRSDVSAKLLNPTLHRSLVYGTYILCRNGPANGINKYFSNTYFGEHRPRNWRIYAPVNT